MDCERTNEKWKRASHENLGEQNMLSTTTAATGERTTTTTTTSSRKELSTNGKVTHGSAHTQTSNSSKLSKQTATSGAGNRLNEMKKDNKNRKEASSEDSDEWSLGSIMSKRELSSVKSAEMCDLKRNKLNGGAASKHSTVAHKQTVGQAANEQLRDNNRPDQAFHRKACEKSIDSQQISKQAKPLPIATHKEHAANMEKKQMEMHERNSGANAPISSNKPTELNQALHLIESVLKKSSGLPSSEKHLDFPPFIGTEVSNAPNICSTISVEVKNEAVPNGSETKKALITRKLIKVAGDLFDTLFDEQIADLDKIHYVSHKKGDTIELSQALENNLSTTSPAPDKTTLKQGNDSAHHDQLAITSEKLTGGGKISEFPATNKNASTGVQRGKQNSNLQEIDAMIKLQKLNEDSLFKDITIPDLPIERFYEMGRQFKQDINLQKGKIKKWKVTIKSAIYYSMCAYKLEMCESPRAYKVYKETMNMFVSLVMGISGSNRENKTTETILKALSYLIKSTISLQIYKMKRGKLLGMQKKIDAFLKTNKNFGYPGNFSINNNHYITDSSSGINSDASPPEHLPNEESRFLLSDENCIIQDSEYSKSTYPYDSLDYNGVQAPYDKLYNSNSTSKNLKATSISLPCDIYNSIYSVNYVQYFLGQAFDWWEKFDITKQFLLNGVKTQILHNRDSCDSNIDENGSIDVERCLKILSLFTHINFHSISIKRLYKITHIIINLV